MKNSSNQNEAGFCELASFQRKRGGVKCTNAFGTPLIAFALRRRAAIFSGKTAKNANFGNKKAVFRLIYAGAEFVTQPPKVS